MIDNTAWKKYGVHLPRRNELKFASSLLQKRIKNKNKKIREMHLAELDSGCKYLV